LPVSSTDATPALSVWIELAKTVKPAVVNVSTTQRGARSPLGDDFFRRFFQAPTPPERRTSLGSGFIVSPDGYVATNDHVVRESGDIVVRLPDQREHRARLVGTDEKTDIALLRIEASGLPTIPFGDSDRLEVGEPAQLKDEGSRAESR
jgi:serine protease Do